MARRAPSVLRVALAAVALLGALSAALLLVGQPATASAGPLTLPDPVPLTAIRYAAPPLKVLLVGDSMAGSLGVGMEVLAAAYHVELANAGHPGCSLSMDGEILLSFGIPAQPGHPCVEDRPGALLATWRRWVDAFRPDVVVYLARSDLLNQKVHHRWTWIGRPGFDRWFSQRLRAAIAVLSSKGAKVVLAVPPVTTAPAGEASGPWNDPVRVGRDGAALRRAAAAQPGTVSVYALDQLLTPGFTYRASADGVPLRCADGVHLTREAGIVVAADLFPRLWRLAGGHRVAGGGTWVHGAVPTSTPGWYASLPCGS